MNRPPHCRPRVKEVILVEGRYDKNTLLQVVDAAVLECRGFRVFRDKELCALLYRLALSRGLIVLTDSDSAGFLIRNHLKGRLPPGAVKHAYIPDRKGKERRKTAPGAEGMLGVEGMPPHVLLKALRDAGAVLSGGQSSPHANPPPGGISKQDFFLWGLSGSPDSAKRRADLQAKLDLPARLTANALLQALNLLFSRQEVQAMLDKSPFGV